MTTGLHRPAPAADRVRLSRRGAVGWRDVPVDGLNCYLRSIEAILRCAGLSADDVADELGGVVTTDVHPDGRPLVRLRRTGYCWLTAATGDELWPYLRDRVTAGHPVLLWPDGYFWPGDSYRGRRHVHHHAVLVTGVGPDRLDYLDIDANEGDGFTGSVPLTADTQRACTRLLDVDEVAPPAPPTADEVRGTIAASAPALARLAVATGGMARWWPAHADRHLAHALDLWVLSDVQPQLYLLATVARRHGQDTLAAAAFSAATLSKKISLFLFGLHRYRPRTPYELCADDLARLAEALTAAAVASGRFTVTDPDADGWLWQRLDATARWHFGSGLGTLDDHRSTPDEPG
jgi:hypothetical protein